jgi:hypothetical protein
MCRSRRNGIWKMFKALKRLIFGRPSVRSNRLKLLRKLPAHAICAEIGVWKGEFSRPILEQAQPKELHLIDPWMFRGDLPDRLYGGTDAKAQEDMDCIYEEVKRKFAHAGNVFFHRGKSADVLEAMQDDYFDWVYIDGDHSYEAALQDLEISRRKVRSGGFLAGDDLNWRREEGLPVRRAVEEFAAKHSLKVEEIGAQFLIRL